MWAPIKTSTHMIIVGMQIAQEFAWRRDGSTVGSSMAPAACHFFKTTHSFLPPYRLYQRTLTIRIWQR
jgi:hypothetical protein